MTNDTLKKHIEIKGEIGKFEKSFLHKYFDHSWFNKNDIKHNADRNEVVVYLKSHDEKSKARKKILGFTIWNNSIPPKENAELIIHNVVDFKISDEDNGKKIQDIILGGLIIEDQEIYIGSFCGWESEFHIDIKVSKVWIEMNIK